jgi:hypothetical protein
MGSLRVRNILIILLVFQEVEQHTTAYGVFLGIAAALATSDLCINSGEASVGDCFWSNDTSQGISVAPKQLIYMNPFITFPPAPGIVPFRFCEKDITVSDKDDKIFTLIETDLLPHFDQQASALEVKFAS